MTGSQGDVRPFQTKAEIKAYLGEDRLACLICGMRLTVLPAHLKARHAISADDYRIRFGIPFSYGLAGQAFRRKAQARMLDLRARGVITGPEPDKIAAKLRAGYKRPRTAPALRNDDVEKLMRVHGRRSPWQARDFEEFVHRVESGRSVAAVGRDADMPSRQTLFKYLARHPILKARYDRVRQAQPLAVQVSTRKTGPLYRQTIARLRKAGMTWAQISAATGIKASTLRNAWRTIRLQTVAL